MPRRDRVADLPSRRDVGRVRGIARDGDGFDLGSRLVGGCLERRERPGALAGALGDNLSQLLRRNAVSRLRRHRERELLRAERARALRRDRRRPANARAGDLAGLTEAHEQDALRLASARIEQERFVPLSLEVAARHGAVEKPSRHAVELGQRRRQGGALAEGEGEQRGFELREGRGRDGAGDVRHAR